jgi:hypothetical protein
MSKLLNFQDNLKSFCKDVERLAQRKAEAGLKIPGMKLVKKNAHRKWVNEREVESKLLPLLGKELYNRKMKSIAQVEKVVKSMKLPDTSLNGLWMKPDKGYDLVPASDKRTEVMIETGLVDLEEDNTDLDFM